MAELQKPDDGAPPVVNKAYEFVLWLLPKVEKFPRSHRFTIGDRLTMIGLALVETAFTTRKEELLQTANRKGNSTRYLLRLAPNESGPGPYRAFAPIGPIKSRLISAAPLRERVVNHPLTRVLEPIFEPPFFPHSLAGIGGWAV